MFSFKSCHIRTLLLETERKIDKSNTVSTSLKKNIQAIQVPPKWHEGNDDRLLLYTAISLWEKDPFNI